MRAIRAFLEEALSRHLAIGTLEQSLLESARACDPLQAQLFEELVQAETAVRYVDETLHRQGGEALYRWTLASLYTVLLVIGPRNKEIFQAMFGSTYAG